MKALFRVSVCFLWLFASLVKPQAVCDTSGEVRLVDGLFPSEGRVEICFNNTWVAICNVGWDTIDARVMCRQLGYPIEGSLSARLGEIGPGNGTWFVSDLQCTGNEQRLEECTYTPTPTCSSNTPAGAVCEYDGSPTIYQNRQLQPNNSVINLTDIQSIETMVICLTNRHPCCTVVDGNWLSPEESVVPERQTSNNSDFFQLHLPRNQLVGLMALEPITQEGIFHCQIADRDSISPNHHLYIGIYSTGAGVPMVTDIRYERSSQTVICTSTGGPATTVTWRRSNAILTVDQVTYQQSQIITNTSTATYENRLRLVKESPETYGAYTCTVSNLRGNDSSTPLGIGICDDGETLTGDDGRVSALCFESQWFLRADPITTTTTAATAATPESVMTTANIADTMTDDEDSNIGTLTIILASVAGAFFLGFVALSLVSLLLCASLKKSKKKPKSPPLQECNQYKEVTDDHLEGNGLYGSPLNSPFSPSREPIMPYDFVEINRQDAEPIGNKYDDTTTQATTGYVPYSEARNNNSSISHQAVTTPETGPNMAYGSTSSPPTSPQNGGIVIPPGGSHVLYSKGGGGGGRGGGGEGSVNSPVSSLTAGQKNGGRPKARFPASVPRSPASAAQRSPASQRPLPRPPLAPRPAPKIPDQLQLSSQLPTHQEGQEPPASAGGSVAAASGEAAAYSRLLFPN